MVTLLKILQSLPLPRLLPLRCFLLGTTSRSYEDDYYNSNPTGNNNSKNTNHTESPYATTQDNQQKLRRRLLQPESYWQQQLQTYEPHGINLRNNTGRRTGEQIEPVLINQ